MKDNIEVGDLAGAHRIWRNVSIGGVILTIIFVGVAFASPNPTACLAVAAVSLALAAFMLVPMRYVDHSLVLAPEGICWISKARRKVLPWSEVARARVDIPTHSSSGDYRPRLYIDRVDGGVCEESQLRFADRNTADLINKMKEVYGGANKAVNDTPPKPAG